jgi:two-component system OmpR family sensor kinase
VATRLTRLLGRISLAGRISALTVVVMTFGLALAGVGTLSLIRDAQTADIDRELSKHPEVGAYNQKIVA